MRYFVAAHQAVAPRPGFGADRASNFSKRFDRAAANRSAQSRKPPPPQNVREIRPLQPKPTRLVQRTRFRVAAPRRAGATAALTFPTPLSINQGADQRG